MLNLTIFFISWFTCLSIDDQCLPGLILCTFMRSEWLWISLMFESTYALMGLNWRLVLNDDFPFGQMLSHALFPSLTCCMSFKLIYFMKSYSPCLSFFIDYFGFTLFYALNDIWCKPWWGMICVGQGGDKECDDGGKWIRIGTWRYLG